MPGFVIVGEVTSHATDYSFLEIFHKIAYITNIITCLIITLIFLTLKYFRHNQPAKYRLACQVLALAVSILGIGNALVYYWGNGQYMTVDIFSFFIIFIAFLQAWLFSFLLIMLLRETYVTRKNLILHLLPALCYAGAYLLSLVWWDDIPVFSFSEWMRNVLHNPPLFIRSLSFLLYFTQLGVYTYVFFRERDIYLHEYGNQFNLRQMPELKGVTNSFLFALFIGCVSITSSIFPSQIYDTALTFAITAFYIIFSIYYANFHYTYITLISPAATPLRSSIQAPLHPPAQTRNHRLFAQAERQMNEKQWYLDPSFNRTEFARILCTNEKYLNAALSDIAGMTIQSYITSWRVRHSQSELRSPDNLRNMEEIALSSGFSSLRSFNRIFRETTGQTPSEFRKSSSTIASSDLPFS
ncbi:MAG: helix-turn-helix transcriptional regulator [Tannerellaceae bacterium]|nr:helix-turn-helix transcriptional regulator [Tannerellaceae bacterium]